MAGEESISLEETNAIRIKLGLAPLKPPSETAAAVPSNEAGNASLSLDEEERIAVDNLKKLRAEQAKEIAQQDLRKRLQKAKDRKALNQKLVGHTLGEAGDDDEDDLKSWLKKSKKREKEAAARREKELEEQDKLFQQEYTASDLRGLRVGHDFEDIEAGEGMILTIKDKGVLDDDDGMSFCVRMFANVVDEGDELVSTALVEKARLKENLENKVRKPKYDPYAEQYDPNTGEKQILSKYDEEKKSSFVLGGDSEARRPALREQTSVRDRHLTMISLDFDGPQPIASDYADVKIKKPKKKAKNLTRVNEILEDEGLAPNVSTRTAPTITVTSTKRAYNEDSGLGDDEELQELLAQRRREALKKRKISRPEDIVQIVRQIRDDDAAGTDNGGLVIDDTSEFVQGLELSRLEGDTGEERSTRQVERMQVDENEEEMPDLPAQPEENHIDNVPSTGLDEEPVITSSVAATLAALKRSNELDASSNFTADELERREEILERQRIRRIQQEQEARERRERERQDEQFKRMSQREREQYREQVNQARERQEAERRMREFNEFKFNVGVDYKDEFGQDMSQKEAFKRLSHAFHGKASGTMKKGKYLEKVLKQTKSQTGSIDKDLHKVEDQRERLKKAGTAHTRIQ